MLTIMGSAPNISSKCPAVSNSPVSVSATPRGDTTGRPWASSPGVPTVNST